MFVLQWFEQQMIASPDAFAIVCEGRRMTYRELNAAAGHIAYGLEQAGVGNGTLVAVLLDRSPEAIAALLGIWKVGGVALPIDRASPAQRVAFLIDDAAAPYLLTRSLTRLNALGGLSVNATILDLDTLCAPASSPGPARSTPAAPSKDAAAYVVYTSGSTGKPKGVSITHAGLANTVDAVRNDLALHPKDVVLAWSTFAFDVAFLEICLPLVCGATLYLGDELAAGRSRVEQLRRSAATVLLGTPTMYRLLIEEGWQGDPRMQLIVGGELLSRELALKLCGMSRATWNQYGPTETSICATRERIERDAEIITIGHPLPNVTVHLLDANFQPVPQGTEGEIYIGGAGVALGYLNRPELTRTSFLPDPFAPGAHGRLYKSGDLAIQRADGRFVFVGRTDSQVKLRGFRIELQEIESALRQCPGVREAVVRAIELEPGDQRLIAFVLSEENGAAQTSPEAWQQALRDRLPAYMVPSEFVPLFHFPTTPSGKVDLRALDALVLSKTILPSTPAVSSTDVVEAWLLSAWQRLLKRKNVGIHDDFFSLGGHSLLAARMLAQVEDRFGCKIPHAVLGEAPTIHRLARYIRQAPAPQFPAVVTLQVGAQRPPLFIAHGIGGSVLSFMELAKELGQEHPVYALQLPVLLDTPDVTFGDLAATYLRQVRALQPEGPYHFAGHSSGGLLVFEMACRLMEQGEVVALLALLDCEPEPGTLPHRPFRNWRSLVAACTRLHVRFTLGEVSLRQWLRRRIDHHRIQVRTWLAVRARRAGRSPARSVRAEGYLALALREYNPRPYSGAITVFMAQDEPRFNAGLADVWAARTLGRCETVLVRGTHLTMLSRPPVVSLAQALKQRLQTVSKASLPEFVHAEFLTEEFAPEEFMTRNS